MRDEWHGRRREWLGIRDEWQGTRKEWHGTRDEWHGLYARRISSSSRRPSGQGPWPLSVLRWPAAPALTNRLPQASATWRARLGLIQGSSSLATRMLGNGSAAIGIGRNPVGPLG